MLGPIDYDSLDFQTRRQIMRLESITCESRPEILRKSVDLYYQHVMAAATEEQLQAASRRDEEKSGRR